MCERLMNIRVKSREGNSRTTFPLGMLEGKKKYKKKCLSVRMKKERKERKKNTRGEPYTSSQEGVNKSEKVLLARRRGFSSKMCLFVSISV